MKYAAFLALLTSLFIVGCSRLPSNMYPIKVDGKKAVAIVKYKDEKVHSYSVDFGVGPGKNYVRGIRGNGRDDNKNGIPDADWILVACKSNDLTGREVERANPYEKIPLSDGKWEWRSLGDQICNFTPDMPRLASDTEEAIRAVEQDQ